MHLLPTRKEKSSSAGRHHRCQEMEDDIESSLRPPCHNKSNNLISGGRYENMQSSSLTPTDHHQQYKDDDNNELSCHNENKEDNFVGDHGRDDPPGRRQREKEPLNAAPMSPSMNKNATEEGSGVADAALQTTNDQETPSSLTPPKFTVTVIEGGRGKREVIVASGQNEVVVSTVDNEPNLYPSDKEDTPSHPDRKGGGGSSEREAIAAAEEKEVVAVAPRTNIEPETHPLDDEEILPALHNLDGSGDVGKPPQEQVDIDTFSTQPKQSNMLDEYPSDDDELCHILMCPICLELPNKTAYQCQNGHIICEECILLVNNCPTCRIPYNGSRIRSLLADAFLASRQTERHGSIKNAKDSAMMYKTVTNKTAITVDIEESSRIMTYLPLETHVDIVQVSHQPENDRIRGRVSTGGWITIKNTKTSHVWATQVPLGIYQVVVKVTTVARDIYINSKCLQDLPRGSYVEIIQVKSLPKDYILRGQLSSGGWISLHHARPTTRQIECSNTGEANSSNMLYKTVANKTAVTADLTESSRIMTYLPLDTYVDIVEVYQHQKDGRLCGRLSTGGWITVKNTKTSNVWLNKAPLGLYETVAKVTTVAEDVYSTSKRLQVLPRGSHVDIVQLKALPMDYILRGQLSSGGWISLHHAKFQFPSCAWPATNQIEHSHIGEVSTTSTSLYKTVADKTALTIDLEESSRIMTYLPLNTYVDIVEVSHQPENDRLRGRVSSGGWITIKNTKTSHVWATQVPLGIYETVAKKTRVAEDVHKSSKCLQDLPRGSYVEVIQVKYTPKENRIRGQLSIGGWISLQDTKFGLIWARPVMLGIYRTLVDVAIVNDKLQTMLKGRQNVPLGAYIKILEIKYVPEENILLGRIGTGGWINLLNSLSGRLYAVPVELGMYKIVASAARLSETMVIPSKRKIKNDLPRGMCVQIVEVEYLPDKSRLWGRVADGGWISIADTATGKIWAEHVGSDIAAF